MSRTASRELPESHPLRGLFRRLTARGMAQVGVSEASLVHYLSDMLVRFVRIDNLYRLRDSRGLLAATLVDMLVEAEAAPRSESRDAYRHIGDFALFILGFYPESLGGQRRLLGPDAYAERGRASYLRAAELPSDVPPSSVLRGLAENFESCAVGLHWVRQYTHDPFYQYMLKQYRLL